MSGRGTNPDPWRALAAAVSAADAPSALRLASELATDATGRLRTGVILGALDCGRADPGTVIRVHVAGTATTAHLAAPLRGALAARGLLGDCSGFEHGRAREDLATSPTRPVAVTILLADAVTVAERLPAPWRPPDLDRVLRDLGSELAAWSASAVGDTGHGLVVTATLPMPPWFPRSLVDLAARAEVGRVWRRFDTEVLALHGDRVAVVDATTVIGAPAADRALALRAHSAWSFAAVDGLADAFAVVVAARAGRSRRAIVTDLDDTLWGGVLGDLGPSGIDLTEDGGRPVLQGHLRQLASQGVLVGISSKNDEDLVDAAFAERADGMVLRPEDVAARRIGWQPKREGVSEVLTELEVAPDHAVFLDDSAFERDDVVSALPGILAVPADGDPVRVEQRLVELDPFLQLDRTEEDTMRAASIRSAAALREAGADYPTYLAGLGQVLRLRPMAEADVARVAQLSLRTNQFNLTTDRRSAAELRAFAAEPGATVWVGRLLDRLADHGIVGVASTRRTGSELHIENVLVSCRVFGRDVERAFVEAVLVAAATPAVTSVVGHHRPTERNRRFADFWARLGFHQDDEGGTWRRPPGRPPGAPEVAIAVRVDGVDHDEGASA
jgi:FkbH-like protein